MCRVTPAKGFAAAVGASVVAGADVAAAVGAVVAVGVWVAVQDASTRLTRTKPTKTRLYISFSLSKFIAMTSHHSYGNQICSILLHLLEKKNSSKIAEQLNVFALLLNELLPKLITKALALTLALTDIISIISFPVNM
jgi:hypothetical protein